MCLCHIQIHAQAYNPDYKDFSGITYMLVPNGCFYGNIDKGYPQGKGCAFFKDKQLGWVVYNGNFKDGKMDGLGGLWTSDGCIIAYWKEGRISRHRISTKYDVKKCCDEITEVYNTKVRPNLTDIAYITLPGNLTTEVQVIQSDTYLGRKISKRFGEK